MTDDKYRVIVDGMFGDLSVNENDTTHDIYQGFLSIWGEGGVLTVNVNDGTRRPEQIEAVTQAELGECLSRCFANPEFEIGGKQYE